MAITTSAPIDQALVVKLRSNLTLKALISGIHEGIAPQGVDYPFLVYHTQYAPYEHVWGGEIIEAGYVVMAWAENSVDAKNIDTLTAQTLHHAQLSVTGQSTLLCRRVSDLKSYDVDEEGKKVYSVGGLYEIWTGQNL